jgi:isoquinoline 1-oxidoreductase beta subunit
MNNTAMTRRTFLKVTTVAGSGLAVGCVFGSAPNLSSPQAEESQLGVWVRIAADNRITLVVPASEMGQGAHTGQAMLLAEQLEADWDTIEVVTAPVGSEYGNKKFLNHQVTGGSSSVTAWWDELSEVGAATREMLVKAAAQRWQVPASECSARAGRVHHEATARSLDYGQLAGAASRLRPPWRPKLKPEKAYRLIGKPVPRLDIPSKVNGSAVFGIDVRRHGMRFAAVSQSPVFGGEVASYDEASALGVKGVESVVAVPNGIAVVADSTWHAQKGLEALAPTFTGGITKGLDSTRVNTMLRETLDEIGKAEVEGPGTIDVEYQVPFLMHATLEPMNCTAHVTETACDVWVPTQDQDKSESAAVEASGLPSDQVNIHTTLSGGGFGRRLEADFVTQAVTLSKAVSKPVQVIWSREEDTRHGFYRPASMSRFQISLGADGKPERWANQLACPSVAATIFPIVAWFDFDPITYEGAKPIPYAVADFDMEYSGVEFGVPIGSLRSVGALHNGFYVESVIDEAAHLAGADPFEYRLALLEEHPRYRKVLERVARESNWGSALPERSGRGIAITECFDSVIAQVVEVSVTDRGRLKIHRVDCVADCGRVVNPDIVRSQMEGGIVFGLSIAMREEITIENGHVVQSNFDDYRIMKMKESPLVNVHIMQSDADSGGAGEPGVPPAAPALTNAIYAATGKRIRRMPIGKQQLI